MIDVHCHLNFKAFNDDCDEVIKQATDAGVEKIINVGTKIDSSLKAVELAEKYANLYAIVGVHPHHADKLEDGWDKLLEEIAINKKVVAIGEIGIDYYRYQSNDIVDPSLQKKVFITQIELARKLALPLQIHNRHAGGEIIEILEKNKSLLLNPPGMFHCMSGNPELLKKVLNLGFYVGFDGNITYEGKAPGEDTALSELVSNTPLDRIVLETDSPYLTPLPYRGRRNEPAYVIMVGEHIAKLKGTSVDEVAKQTTKNVLTVFPKTV